MARTPYSSVVGRTSSPWRGWHRWPWLLLTILLGVMAAAGCRHDTSEEEVAAQREAAKKALAEKKNEPPKDPFTFQSLNVRPSETDRIGSLVKPGHWTTAVLGARANRDDFRGELVNEILAADGAPAELDGIPSHLVCSRPVILPKDQMRSLDVDLLLPVSTPSRLVGARLLTGPGGRDATTPPRDIVVRMPAHQCYLVGLVRTPEAYQYLKSLDAVRASSGETYTNQNPKEHHYQVLLPAIKTEAPLPAHSLYWTTIAYVLWDDLEPSLLSSDQQRALLDWLHWGGQIIISGPNSLDLLRGSFLEPYLPASGGDTWPMDKQVLADLSREWSRSRELSVAKPWSGQKLLPRGATGQRTLATDPSGQPLVVERLVGAGRIVVTAFRLSQRELVNWPGYDGFFNACLLRRGPRRFGRNAELRLAVNWQDGDRYDPRLTTRVRYFTRDADATTGTVLRKDGFQESWTGQQMSSGQPMPGGIPFFPRGGPWTGGGDGWVGDGEPVQGAGVAGWNDNSPTSGLARRSLREAAGITVPKASFVLAILGAYVIVLVPLNWFIFSRLGRVEWAWIAAPIVAIIFGMLVVWLAQVNIGFARSATEVAVLEVQGGYGRGHLTRYTALYSSLSTSYDLSLADAGAAALPMPARTDPGFLQSRSTVTLRRWPGSESASQDGETTAVSLEGFQVSSNSTGMVHSEQMLELGGAIEFESLASQRCRVRNGTRYGLDGAGLVSGRSAGWIGALEPGQTATVELTERKGRAYFREWESFEVAARTPSPGEISLRPLLELACDQISAGQTRLVAWTFEELPGMSIQPGAAQLHRATLVVAHVDCDPEPPPRPDSNSRADFPRNFDEEESQPVEPPAEEQPGNVP